MNRSRRRRERTGTEPSTARTDLGLRILLSAIFAPVFAAAATASAVAAVFGGDTAFYTILAVIFAALAMVALADLTVLANRRRRGG
jgi:membrane protein implicated in regulation of membrane protease activity